MSSQSLRKDAAIENQRFFPYKNPGEEEVKTMVSVVAETTIAMTLVGKPTSRTKEDQFAKDQPWPQPE